MSYTLGASAASSISGTTITASNAATTATISNDGKALTECGVILTHHASATKGARVEVWRTYDGGTTYQVTADAPYAFNIPFTANTTVRFVFSVPGSVSQFKVTVVNLDTGQSITAATVNVRQATN